MRRPYLYRLQPGRGAHFGEAGGGALEFEGLVAGRVEGVGLAGGQDDQAGAGLVEGVDQDG